MCIRDRLIHLPHELHRLIVRQPLLLHLPRHAVLLRRGDEHTQQPHVLLPQDKVGAAPHKDTFLALRQPADLVALQRKQHLRRRPSAQYVIVPLVDGLEPVSYTHLDVYKRQHVDCDAVRVTVRAAHGSPEARIFELRVY